MLPENETQIKHNLEQHADAYKSQPQVWETFQGIQFKMNNGSNMVMKKKLDQQVARQNHKSHNMSLNRGVAFAMVSLCFVFSVVGARGGTG